MGAPGYNIGTFEDTIPIYHNVAVYKQAPEFDATCRITFRFSEQGVRLEQESENPNFGCGFGFCVYASGYYKKVSSKAPDFSKFTGR